VTPAVVFDHVSKKFRRGERHNSLRDLIPSLVRRTLRPRQADVLDTEEFWAVRDVSFAVEAGQALGIIGRNGAGKSTTLKLLTRILKPTCGSCAVRGRVGTLIEVAAGFHPDLTGLENIYLQGAIMGMRRAEIARKLDTIIDFAGVGAFVDTPVKRYSSGMNARLGFSIAAHLGPDVLIIDEVLSVGDMAFQQRCFDRMEEFRRDGVAIVLVSHNLQAVASLCDRALHIDGSTRAFGPAATVIEHYVSSSGAWDAKGDSAEFKLERVKLHNGLEEVQDAVAPGTPLCLDATWRVRSPMTDLTFGFRVYRSTDGLLVFDGHVSDSELSLGELEPDDVIQLRHRFRPHLARGQYHIELFVYHNPSGSVPGHACPAGAFRIAESRTHRSIVDVELTTEGPGPSARVTPFRQTTTVGRP
jgi:ABC-type polysaccharide/polyol phosphate transport system ATPase subunit